MGLRVLLIETDQPNASTRCEELRVGTLSAFQDLLRIPRAIQASSEKNPTEYVVVG